MTIVECYVVESPNIGIFKNVKGKSAKICLYYLNFIISL